MKPVPSTMRNAVGSAQTVILSWRARIMPGLNLAGVLPAAVKSDAILSLFHHQSQLHESPLAWTRVLGLTAQGDRYAPGYAVAQTRSVPHTGDLTLLTQLDPFVSRGAYARLLSDSCCPPFVVTAVLSNGRDDYQSKGKPT